jgi:hypothetical protein
MYDLPKSNGSDALIANNGVDSLKTARLRNAWRTMRIHFTSQWRPNEPAANGDRDNSEAPHGHPACNLL